MKQESKKLLPYISPILEIIDYRTEDGFSSLLTHNEDSEEFSEITDAEGDNSLGGEWLEIM